MKPKTRYCILSLKLRYNVETVYQSAELDLSFVSNVTNSFTWNSSGPKICALVKKF